MAEAPNPFARYDVPIWRTSQIYILELVKTGVLGDTPEAVIRQLVIDGVRRAIADGLIAVQEINRQARKPPPAPPSPSR